MARQILRKIGRDPRMPVTFLSVFLFGFAAHGMGLTNKFSFHDDIFALFWTGSTIASGRWMLHVIGVLETFLFGDGHFSLPLANGLFSFCCIGVAACLIVDLLRIRKPVYCAALGGLMVVFPVITGYFGYVFTMPYYLLSMGMMVLAAYLLCRGKKWWTKIAAILLGGCSLGIYQAFLPLLLSLTLLYDMRLLAEDGIDLRSFWKKAGIQLLCMAGVMLFYFGMNRFFLAKFHLEMNSYMGMNQMESTPLGVYLTRAGRAYREFFLPTRNVPSDMYPMHLYYMHLIMLFVIAALGIRTLIRVWRADRGRALLLALLGALIPLGSNFIFVMSETVHGLMTYGQITVFALLLRLLDGLEVRTLRLRRAVSFASALLLVLTGAMYIRFDNQCYLKTVFQQQQAISFFTVLTARIKGTEGYTDEAPVVFLNQENISDQSLYNIDELDFIQLDSYGETITSYLNSYAWYAFMERWCGYGPVYGDPAACAELPEVREMPHYPDDGSVRRVGDMIVVNF